jgi:hypothetical protein
MDKYVDASGTTTCGSNLVSGVVNWKDREIETVLETQKERCNYADEHRGTYQ